MRGIRGLAAALVGLSLVAAACSSDKGVKLGAKHTMGSTASFELIAADQTSSGKTLKVPEADLKDTKGYVAIHADANGAPGPVLGVSDLLPAGQNKNIRIKFNKQLTTSQDVWPMVHVEDNNDGKYDFPPNDVPAKFNGQVVVIKVHLDIR